MLNTAAGGQANAAPAAATGGQANAAPVAGAPNGETTAWGNDLPAQGNDLAAMGNDFLSTPRTLAAHRGTQRTQPATARGNDLRHTHPQHTVGPTSDGETC